MEILEKLLNRVGNTMSNLDIFHIALARHLVIELIKTNLIHPADEFVAQNVIIKAMNGSAQ